MCLPKVSEVATQAAGGRITQNYIITRLLNKKTFPSCILFFSKWHLMKAYSTSLLLYMNLTHQKAGTIMLKTNALLSLVWLVGCFFFWRIYQHEDLSSMIGPKLCVPVPEHISLGILLTCLLVSTTCLVYLRVMWTALLFGCTPAPASLHPRFPQPLHLLSPLHLSLLHPLSGFFLYENNRRTCGI